MDNSHIMKISQAQSNLKWKYLGPLFSNIEFPVLNIVEQVSALHVLQHDIIVIVILKQVN